MKINQLRWKVSPINLERLEGSTFKKPSVVKAKDVQKLSWLKL